MRAAGNPDISQSAVRTALRQAEAAEDDVDFTEFTPASEIDFDAEDSYYTAWYGDPDPPYDADTIVIDGTAEESLSVYRFWDSSTGPGHEAGPWTADAADIDRLRSQSDAASEVIIDRYSLPGDADRVTKFDVDAGTNVRISEVGPNYGGDGGGTQYEIRGDDMRKDTDQIDVSDMPVHKQSETSITEFLNTE